MATVSMNIREDETSSDITIDNNRSTPVLQIFNIDSDSNSSFEGFKKSDNDDN